jgi:hypothetical protein
MTHTDPLETIRQGLWTGIGPEQYGDEGDKYRGAILEQYKIYVEMADRTSARRGITNTFFLTLNTLIFTLVAVFWKDKPPDMSTPVILILLVVALGQCWAWWAIVKSYSQLNAAKYQVVGALEERLPASPYWQAEWTALGLGRDPKLYRPLTSVERWIPRLFGVVYTVGAMLGITA